MSREVYIRAVVKLGSQDPDFKEVISPMEARRMGRLLKRAVWCSSKALQEAGIVMPDAVITATDYGCMENSEAFLQGVLNPQEGAMSPTKFMQSTHNTIGSLIAIRLGCHGYNATYSHTGCSLRSALEDAMMQLHRLFAGLRGIIERTACLFQHLHRFPSFCRAAQHQYHDSGSSPFLNR